MCHAKRAAPLLKWERFEKHSYLKAGVDAKNLSFLNKEPLFVFTRQHLVVVEIRLFLVNTCNTSRKHITAIHNLI